MSSMPDVAGDVVPEVVIFADVANIKERWPGLDGNQLLEKCFESFAINRNTTLKLMDEDGRQLLLPHAENVRHQTVVVEEYIRSVPEHGVVQEGAKPSPLPATRATRRTGW